MTQASIAEAGEPAGGIDTRWRSGAHGGDRGGIAGAGSRDGRRPAGQERTHGKPARLVFGLLGAQPGHPCRQVGIAGAAGPAGTIPHGGVRALPAHRKVGGGGHDGDWHQPGRAAVCVGGRSRFK